MYALEIINVLNDPDNSAKPKGLNAKLRPTPSQRELDRAQYARQHPVRTKTKLPQHLPSAKNATSRTTPAADSGIDFEVGG